MKKLIFGSFLLCASFMAKSQDNPGKGDLKFSAGAELALPIGGFGDAYGVGLGLSGQADYFVSDKVSLNLNVGYLTYQGKSVDFLGTTIKYPSFNVIPVMAGARYSITEKFYGSAQLGLSFWSIDGGNGSDFTFAPGIGYKFSKIDVQLKYNSIGTEGGSSDNLGLRAAYTF